MNFRDLSTEFLKVKYELWTDKTRRYIERIMKHDVYPHLGSKDILTIKPIMIVDLLRRIEETGHTHKAWRVRARIAQIYNYAIACGYCETNPAAPVLDALRPHKTKGLKFIPFDRFSGFLKRIKDQGKASQAVYDAWCLLLYTAKRRGEVVGARWDEFDLKKGLWVIPGDRMKMGIEHTTPLPKQALAMFRRRRRQRKGALYVFPSPHSRAAHINAWSLWQQIRHAGYVGEATIHGVRKTFSTHAHESGLWSIDAIEIQLAHEIGGVRGVYNHARYLNERSRLVQWWADEISEYL